MFGSASSGSRKRNLCNYCKRLEFKAATDEEAEALAVIYFAWATGKISVQRIAALVKPSESEQAVRLAAEDVVQAADLAFSRQMTERDAEIMEAPLARIALAVLAHRKAKAEQAKEASRG